MSAAMTARRPKRRPPPAVALDHGPAIRIARGDVVPVDGPDPDNPNRTVRRAELVVGYHVLWANKLITDDQHEAADRLLVALEAVQGASDGAGTDPAVKVAHWLQGHPATRQVQAAADLRRASEALGAVHYANAVVFVGGNAMPAAWGQTPLSRDKQPQWRLLDDVALRHVRATLETLVQVFGIDA